MWPHSLFVSLSPPPFSIYVLWYSAVCCREGMYATGGARLHQVHTIAETNEHSHLSGGETRIVSLAEMEL